MWQVTRDKWHMTGDTCHIVWDEHSLIIFNKQINYKGDRRTAPATPGLLKISPKVR